MRHACVYCFAVRPTAISDFDAGRDFEREIVVKINAPEVLRVELARSIVGARARRAGHEHRPLPVGGGALPADGGHLGGAARRGQPLFSADEVAAAAARSVADAGNQQSARNSARACRFQRLDEKAWRATEPHTPNPRARLEAVAELNRAGIPTGVLIAPLMPGINDAPHQIEPLLQRAAEAGATSIGGIALHLRGEVRDVFMGWLADQRPDLVERYERLYSHGAYAPREERERLAGLVRRGRRHAPGGFKRVPPPAPRAPVAPTAPVASRQEALF